MFTNWGPTHELFDPNRSDKMRWVHIMKKGEYYETGVTAAFHTILGMYDSTVRPAPLVIDIGMNIGWFSLYSRAHGHDVAGERVVDSKLSVSSSCGRLTSSNGCGEI